MARFAKNTKPDPHAKPISYGHFDADFIAELATFVGNRRVLEVYAGNGLLASLLASRGVDILPTTLFAGHDGHEFGMYANVIEMDAADAVRNLGSDRDILLVSWPTTTSEAMTRAAMEWGSERPIVYIGEITDLELGMLGGCATDLFFETTEVVESFSSYQSRGVIERAVVMQAKPEYVERYTSNVLGAKVCSRGF